MLKIINVEKIDRFFNPNRKQVFEFQQIQEINGHYHYPINFMCLYYALLKRPEYKNVDHIIVHFSSMKEVFNQLAKLGTCEVYVSYRVGEDLSKFVTNPTLQPISLHRKLAYLVKLIR